MSVGEHSGEGLHSETGCLQDAAVTMADGRDVCVSWELMHL